MKKKLSALVACLSLVFMASSSALGSCFTLTPTTINGVDVNGGARIWTGTGNNSPGSEFDSQFPGLIETEIYKSEVDSGEVIGASLFETVYDPDEDPSGADITFTGESPINAGFLVVKAGRNWYLYDISEWNPLDEDACIELSGFESPFFSAISHVSIYGAVVPEPTSIGLFLLGMGCVTGGSFVRRRRA